MNLLLQHKKDLLLRKIKDPRRTSDKKTEEKKNPLRTRFIYGVVSDNKDPECLGRIKVSLDSLSPGSVSPWYQVSGKWKGNGQGIWSLPEIGTQVLVYFPNNSYVNGIVLGSIYSEKEIPPLTTAEKQKDSILLQTKNHRLEIIDEEGKETINIETAEGKMRAEISKKEGIKIINELGDINIKCRKLIMKAEKNIELSTEKGTTITSKDNLEIKTTKQAGISCDKDTVIKGKNIKLSGTQGVTTEGKQLAVQDDKVMGFDVHIMVVPSGPSTTTVPLPHPFIGKINDKVSEDVKIKDKGVAVKGSKAKHDDSMHMQLPGTIQFQNSPKCEGEVTGGTGTKVKVNGKEVAVIGSQVTTCNDMGLQNNSTIIAAGASIPMPVIINPLKAEEFEREREGEEEKEPKFSEVKWSTTSVDEGEEAELTANVQDIADGNMVTLQVFPEGKGPEDSIPLASFPLTVQGGSVSAKWSYHANKSELPPDSDPKFIFSAHCAWCNFEKSSNSLEVKLIRPEITKAEWQDKDGNVITKANVGEEIILYAETKDIEDGTGVTFEIYDENKKMVYSVGTEVKNGKAEIEWKTIDVRTKEDKEELRYYISVISNRCEIIKSELLKVRNPQILELKWDKKAVYYRDKATLIIHSFELSEERPKCKIVLFENYLNKAGENLYEKEITIDKDVIEEEIEFDFSLKELNLTREDLELKVSTNILDENNQQINKKVSLIVVGVGFVYE